MDNGFEPVGQVKYFKLDYVSFQHQFDTWVKKIESETEKTLRITSYEIIYEEASPGLLLFWQTI